jgi:hypothetical protein
MMVRAKDAGTMMCHAIEGIKCTGSNCMAWRFAAMVANPEATIAAMLITGEKAPAPKAARMVLDDPGRFGLPVGEDREGYCGLAGKPEVRS